MKYFTILHEPHDHAETTEAAKGKDPKLSDVIFVKLQNNFNYLKTRNISIHPDISSQTAYGF